jgi:SsrA-binding protein
MLIAKNRKALYNYEITQIFMAGVVLYGYEVKAAKEGKVNFDGAYIQLLRNKPYLVNMHIGRYSKQSQEIKEQDDRRSRPVLLNKKEIETLQRELSEKGKTAVPLALLLKNNMIKLELGIAKGRKKPEKKLLEKERQIKRDLEKAAKEAGRY